jgi:hypothetical protein
MTKYFVDKSGRYLGGFDGATPPDDSIEVPSAPDEASQIWDGGQFKAVIQVPVTVTMRQARLALLAVGKLDAVDAAIDTLESPQKEAARIEWDYARDVERNSPIVALMGLALDLSDEDLDELFIQAATL